MGVVTLQLADDPLEYKRANQGHPSNTSGQVKVSPRKHAGKSKSALEKMWVNQSQPSNTSV